MALFENYEGRMPQLQPVLDKYGFKSFEDVKAFTNGKGVDAYMCIYFMNILLMRIIRIREGSTSAKVATAEPNTPIGAE